MKRYQNWAMVTSLLASLLGVQQSALAFDPNFIISDAEMTNVGAMNMAQIKDFLQKGYLGSLRTADYQGRLRTAADIIWRSAKQNGLNPQVLLVLLQKEQSLISASQPTQKQLDWATGYGVCDSCSMNDPALARWQGFGKQVNSAAMQFTAGYLDDIKKTGSTSGGFGPGISVVVNGLKVTPVNAATAALYSYTPHLHGNENFAKLWQGWFGKSYPNGTLLKTATDPIVWVLKNGERREIATESVLHSRYNPQLIIEVSEQTIATYPEGSKISWPNYSLLITEVGTRYLFANDSLRLISEADYKLIGYSEDELVQVKAKDLLDYSIGRPIQASAGVADRLLTLPGTTSMYYISAGERQLIVDPIIASLKFPGRKPEQATATIVEQYREIGPLLLPEGTLLKTAGDPAVYVISEGQARPIASEATFLSLGYNFGNIVTVSREGLKVHKLGLPVN
ncbi:MAG: hypothetical protein AAB833_02470 [Patescibacteria group bacterium]